MEPQVRLGLAHLSKLAYIGADLSAVQQTCLDQMFEGTDISAALMDLSIIAQIQGNAALGQEFQDKALQSHRSFSINRQSDPQTRVLVFAEPKALGNNTPIEFLLDTPAFEVITFYPGPHSTPADLPNHDVAFCAVSSESLTADAFFDTVRALTADTGNTVLNLPPKLIKPERDALPVLLGDTPGLHTAKTGLFTRDQLADLHSHASAPIGVYPNIIRPHGSHAGLGLEKLTSPADLETYLSRHPDALLFASELFDYASPSDDLFRKQRVVFVDGQPFPVHLAIATRWDVWYMNADMDLSQAKRDEEAVFMDRFADDFCTRHAHALRKLTDTFGLDYFGIDCDEDTDGNLVVFEVDNVLIVHNMEPLDLFPYKDQHMRRLFTAFQDMVSKAAG
ncbi:MAG: ATP-grasp domain-containing protein [Shimia sp.]|uniref:ATP-grasp domain-containing protein n=1 Tax=Shimia sp. TaxID=1954381 RepID=UPI004058D61E